MSVNDDTIDGEGGTQDASPNPNTALRGEEFGALRAEARSRAESQDRLVTLAVLAAGGIFTIGLQPDIGISVPALLVYPILAAYFATLWGQHDIRVGQIAEYICERLEQPGGAGWENYLKNERGHFKGFAPAELGLFLSTELAAVVLAVLRSATPALPHLASIPLLGHAPNQQVFLSVLLILDGIAGIRTFVVARRFWQQRDWHV